MSKKNKEIRLIRLKEEKSKLILSKKYHKLSVNLRILKMRKILILLFKFQLPRVVLNLFCAK